MLFGYCAFALLIAEAFGRCVNHEGGGSESDA